MQSMKTNIFEYFKDGEAERERPGGRKGERLS